MVYCMLGRSDTFDADEAPGRTIDLLAQLHSRISHPDAINAMQILSTDVVF